MKISATLTCFNREKDITNALNSIFHQSLPFYEVIVCDDASTDNSVVVIQNFIKSNNLSNFRLIERKINGGQNAALNSAIQESTGDVICFLDSDDTWLPDVNLNLSKFWNSDTPSEIGLQYGTIVNGPRWDLEGCDIVPLILKQGYLSCLGTLSVRKSILLEISPLPEMPEISDRCQDDRICLEVAKRSCVRAMKVDLLIYGGAVNNSASNKANVALGWHIFFNDYRDLFHIKMLRGYLAVHYFRISIMYITAKKPIKSFNVLLDCLSEIRNIKDILTFTREMQSLLTEKVRNKNTWNS